MSVRAKLLVHCPCAGADDDEVALVDDERPPGVSTPSRIGWIDNDGRGGIRLRAPRSASGEHRQQMVIVNPPFRFENRADLNAGLESLTPHATSVAQQSQSTYNLTHTVWKDGHSSWAVRCMRCGQQVQLSPGAVVAAVDALSAVLDELETRMVPEPGLREDDVERHLVPLGVLHRMVLHIDG